MAKINRARPGTSLPGTVDRTVALPEGLFEAHSRLLLRFFALPFSLYFIVVSVLFWPMRDRSLRLRAFLLSLIFCLIL